MKHKPTYVVANKTFYSILANILILKICKY